jgi:hypothetical protein
MPVSRILNALFGPKKARIFQPTAWPASPVVHHGPPERLPAPFRDGDLSSFERLASSVEIDAGTRGVSVYGSGFRGEVAFTGRRGSQVIHSIRAASPSRLRQAGLNILFQEFRLPSLEPWLDQLAAEVGIPNQAIRLYAFAAPSGGAQGTDAHWDPNEVIHVQLQGTKILRLAPNAHVVNPDMFATPFAEDLVGQFHEGAPVKPPTSWQEVRLRPGSVVYFPRGYWHETSTQVPSFGVGLGFYWPTPVDVIVEHLRARLRQEAGWRAPLFGIQASAAAVRHHEQRLSALMEGLGLSAVQYPPGEALARLLPPGQRVGRRGLAGRYVRLPFTLSRRRQKDENYAILIHMRGGAFLEMEVSAPFSEAIAWIAARATSFSLRELAAACPGLARREQEQILILLLENGAIQFDPRPAKAARAH